jgi:hypothetical protein
LLNEESAGEISCTIPGVNQSFNFPAYYYEMTVYRERNSKTILRRYSHFKWLHQQLRRNPPMDAVAVNASANTLSFPSGSCFYQTQDDDFAQARLELLRDWLSDVLMQPGYASHPAVRKFLELE